MRLSKEFLQLGIAKRVLRSALIRNNNEVIIQVGQGYGSYFLPEIATKVSGVAWLVGAGENLDLDKYLIDKGWNVAIVDPTPRAIEFAQENLVLSDKIKFIQKGLWKESGDFKFYHPKNSDHVSLSITNLQHTTTYSMLATITPNELSSEIGIPLLVKLDVEGAAYEIIDCLLRSEIFPEFLLAEFEQPTSLWKLACTLVKLRRSKYELIHVQNFDTLFMLRSNVNR